MAIHVPSVRLGSIAPERLVIAGRTAGNHVMHVMNKLGLHSRAQVAVRAATNGLTTRSD